MPPTWKDYLFLWEIPVLLVFAAAWIWGGGYVLRWSLARQNLQKKFTLGRCMGASLLSGAAGAVAGGVIYMMVNTIMGSAAFKNVFGEPEGRLSLPGLILGGISLIVVSYLVAFAMFGLSAKRTLVVWGKPMGALVLLALVLLLPTALIARHIGGDNRTWRTCQSRMQFIHRELERYEQDLGSPPADLKQLLRLRNPIPPNFLTCPLIPENEVGYFYVRPVSILHREDPKVILLCDLRDSHGGSGRSVLLIDGTVRRHSEEEFQAMLGEPQNAQFAQALRAFEGR